MWLSTSLYLCYTCISFSLYILPYLSGHRYVSLLSRQFVLYLYILVCLYLSPYLYICPYLSLSVILYLTRSLSLCHLHKHHCYHCHYCHRRSFSNHDSIFTIAIATNIAMPIIVIVIIMLIHNTSIQYQSKITISM